MRVAPLYISDYEGRKLASGVANAVIAANSIGGSGRKEPPTSETNPFCQHDYDLIVGVVFLSEGVQKFVYPESLGVGRFTKIGIPAPELMAPFVGVCEIACGALFVLGLLTRFAAITMIINMLVAISTTKVPMLLNDGFLENGARGSHRLVRATLASRLASIECFSL